jgi:hypothetical protein
MAPILITANWVDAVFKKQKLWKTYLSALQLRSLEPLQANLTVVIEAE